MDELRARDGLGNSDEEFVGRGVEGVEDFEVDDSVWEGPEGAAGVVRFEAHFGEVGAAAGLDIKEDGFIEV